MKNNIFKKIISSIALASVCITIFLGAISVSATDFYAPKESLYGNYFYSDFSYREEVLTSNRELNEEIAGEGIVLLKNEDSLPVSGDLKVSVFGKGSINVLSGGSGYGAGGGVRVTGFIEALQQEGFSVNPSLVNFYKDNSKSGSGRGSAPGNGNVSPGYNTGETPVSYYTEDLEATYENYGDAAIVVFSRISGEGFDLPRTMMWNGSSYKSWGTDATQAVPGARQWDDHYLQLDQNESDLLKYLGEHFDNVIVLLNTGSQFEVGFLDDPGHYGYHENIKGCMWIGYPGSSGNVAVAKALKGEINPSGRTVDTWARDFKNDPVWQNYANNMMEGNTSLKGNQYANHPESGGSGGGSNTCNYVIYKEGIYVGYRYYETRGYTEGLGSYTSAEKGKADVAYNIINETTISLSADKDGDNEVHGTSTTEWKSWYDSRVVYPFGYGLSYTSFEWEVVASTSGVITEDSTIAVQVKVTNTGDVAGKEVVQLYYTAPYTNGGIEKAHVVLGNFAKTKLLQPGESEVVTIEITARDMSSYDWNDANKNGFKGYELEQGTYELKVMKDAHNVVDSFNCVVNETIKYQYSETTGYKIENRFDEVSNYLLTDEYAQDGVGYMSRADFEGTFPIMAYKINESQWVRDAVSMWHNGAVDTPDKPWYTDVMPTTGANNGITLLDLVAVDYDDPLWDLYMDQFTVSQLYDLTMKGSYASGRNYEELGVTRVPTASGSAGFLFGAPSATYSTWCSETLLATTWNTELSRAKGVGMGNEALWGNGSQNIPFWHAPGVNIHRSPFTGRNFEHFSEDGLLSGIMAAALIDGAQSKGLICYVGHLGVNDQEANRCGLLTWLDEQAMREIYIKPWEVCVKDANTIGIMTSLNRIGPCWAGGSYSLLQEILRNEWGFNGVIYTDSYSASWSNADMMIRAGGNLALGTAILKSGSTSATAVTALRNAAQGILYAHANSMAMNRTSPAKLLSLLPYTEEPLSIGVVNIRYTDSVACAVINSNLYPEGDSSEIIYTLKEGSALPKGLTLSPDGTITGIPIEENPRIVFTVVASYKGDSREADFIISVIDSYGSIVYEPSSSALPIAIVDNSCSISVADAKILMFDGSNVEISTLPKIIYSIQDGSALPEGLELTSDGMIVGIPTFECEEYQFTVVASAIGYRDKIATYTISVFHDLTYEALSLEDGSFCEDYFASIAYAECANNVTYKLKNGSTLPKGLTLTSGGYIVGKPTEVVNNHSFTVIASAQFAENVEVTFKISIGVTFDNSIESEYFVENGEEFLCELHASGAENIKFYLSEGSLLPDGLELSEDGIITGTPISEGVYRVVIGARADGIPAGEIKLTFYVSGGQSELAWWEIVLRFLAKLFSISI